MIKELHDVLNTLIERIERLEEAVAKLQQETKK